MLLLLSVHGRIESTGLSIFKRAETEMKQDQLCEH